MIIVVKIVLVALAVFGQAKLFPEGKETAESEFERTALPEDHPELVLARRAMKAEGLCGPGEESGTARTAAPGSPAFPPAADTLVARNVAELCF